MTQETAMSETMGASLLELAERVEALTRPCRETDRAVVLTLHPGAIVNLYCADDDEPTVYHAEPLVRNKRDLPAYTASLDAAMTLVPPKSLWSVCDMEEGPFAQVIRPMPCGGYVNGLTSASAATPALALTAAALRAAQKEPGQ